MTQWTRWAGACCLLALAAILTGCATYPARALGPGTLAAKGSPSVMTPASEPSTAAQWAMISKILGHAGIKKDEVYTIDIPRDDFDVNILGMTVPTAAGIESRFHFYRCSCGKMNVTGEFCLADYEVNDVIDALRQGQIEVVSIGPMLMHTRANPQILRFQGEGQAGPLARALRQALSWTGKERLAPDQPFVRPEIR